MRKKFPSFPFRFFTLGFFLLSTPLLHAGEGQFTLLITGGHHEKVEPAGGKDSSKPVGGVARCLTLIKKIREEVGANKALLVDEGGLFTGSGLSDLTQGEVDCGAYQLMGYNAVVFGDHDLDYGKRAIWEYRKKFKVQWVSANLLDRANSQNFVKPYTSAFPGVRVQMIGFSNPRLPSILPHEKVYGLLFNSPSQVAKGLRSILKKDADIFVALNRLEPEQNQKFAKDNPFIHIIISSGGSGSPSEPHAEKRKDGSLEGPLMIEAGSDGLYLGRLDVTVSGNKKQGYRIRDYHFQSIPITSDIPEDPALKSLLEKYQKRFKSETVDEKTPVENTPTP